MLPQTNLQLYRLLLQRGFDERSLGLARAAYDAARDLFAAAFRPSHKPFLCHLIGTAGALAGWGQSIDVVLAGMLHSAYLYGRFQDGQCGACPTRRHWLHGIIGTRAEGLVYAFTQFDWHLPLDQWLPRMECDAEFRTLATIKLADTLDELVDAGPAFAPAKPLRLGLNTPHEARQELMSLVDACAGPLAAAQFEAALLVLSQTQPPLALRTPDESFHTLHGGVAKLARSKVARALARLSQRTLHTGAAR